VGPRSRRAVRDEPRRPGVGLSHRGLPQSAVRSGGRRAVISGALKPAPYRAIVRRRRLRVSRAVSTGDASTPTGTPRADALLDESDGLLPVSMGIPRACQACSRRARIPPSPRPTWLLSEPDALRRNSCRRQLDGGANLDLLRLRARGSRICTHQTGAAGRRRAERDYVRPPARFRRGSGRGAEGQGRGSWRVPASRAQPGDEAACALPLVCLAGYHPRQETDGSNTRIRSERPECRRREERSSRLDHRFAIRITDTGSPEVQIALPTEPDQGLLIRSLRGSRRTIIRDADPQARWPAPSSLGVPRQ